MRAASRGMVDETNCSDDGVLQPLYYTTPHSAHDIICEGSDAEETEEEVRKKRLRYEFHAQRIVNGFTPTIQSASLRGPFDDRWTNPWGYRTRKEKSNSRDAESGLVIEESLLETEATGFGGCRSGTSRSTIVRNNTNVPAPLRDSPKPYSLGRDGQTKADHPHSTLDNKDKRKRQEVSQWLKGSYVSKRARWDTPAGSSPTPMPAAGGSRRPRSSTSDSKAAEITTEVSVRTSNEWKSQKNNGLSRSSEPANNPIIVPAPVVSNFNHVESPPTTSHSSGTVTRDSTSIVNRQSLSSHVPSGNQRKASSGPDSAASRVDTPASEAPSSTNSSRLPRLPQGRENSKIVGNESFVTDFVPSSRNVEEFQFRKKRGKSGLQYPAKIFRAPELDLEESPSSMPVISAADSPVNSEHENVEAAHVELQNTSTWADDDPALPKTAEDSLDCVQTSAGQLNNTLMDTQLATSRQSSKDNAMDYSRRSPPSDGNAHSSWNASHSVDRASLHSQPRTSSKQKPPPGDVTPLTRFELPPLVFSGGNFLPTLQTEKRSTKNSTSPKQRKTGPLQSPKILSPAIATSNQTVDFGEHTSSSILSEDRSSRCSTQSTGNRHSPRSPLGALDESPRSPIATLPPAPFLKPPAELSEKTRASLSPKTKRKMLHIGELSTQSYNTTPNSSAMPRPSLKSAPQPSRNLGNGSVDESTDEISYSLADIQQREENNKQPSVGISQSSEQTPDEQVVISQPMSTESCPPRMLDLAHEGTRISPPALDRDNIDTDQAVQISDAAQNTPSGVDNTADSATPKVIAMLDKDEQQRVGFAAKGNSENENNEEQIAVPEAETIGHPSLSRADYPSSSQEQYHRSNEHGTREDEEPANSCRSNSPLKAQHEYHHSPQQVEPQSPWMRSQSDINPMLSHASSSAKPDTVATEKSNRSSFEARSEPSYQLQTSQRTYAIAQEDDYLEAGTPQMAREVISDTPVPVTQQSDWQEFDVAETPEYDDIRPFKDLMSPQKPSREPQSDTEDLPSTQLLYEAAVRNPWDSTRKASGTKKRVSFNILPETEDRETIPGASDSLQTPKSPPPPKRYGNLNDEDNFENDTTAPTHFGKHFTAASMVKQKGTTATGSQSPGVGAMAETFIRADRAGPSGHKRRASSDQMPSRYLRPLNGQDNKPRGYGRSSLRSSCGMQSEESDVFKTNDNMMEVNLDDFLGGDGGFLEDWSVESEMKKSTLRNTGDDRVMYSGSHRSTLFEECGRYGI